MNHPLRLLLPALLATTVLAGAPNPGYHLLREIPIGGEGGWDYLTVDPAAHRLYVSHGQSVVVVDTETNRVVGEIAGTPGVHGLAVAADLGRGFTTNGRENKVSVVDLATLRTLQKVGTGANPDAMLYDPATHEVYVFNGRSASATVIAAGSGVVTATIPLGGKPEFAEVDPAAGLVLNALEDTSEVIAIDAGSHAVAQRWPLAPGEEPTGVAIDVQHHRLFAGCGNRQLVMLDYDTGKVAATVPIGQGVDACGFDPGTQLAFASCGDGTVTIAHETAPDKLEVVQTLATAPRARTMAVDPAMHRIYLATASFEAPPPPAPGATPARPKLIPGTFRILVYGPQ